MPGTNVMRIARFALAAAMAFASSGSAVELTAAPKVTQSATGSPNAEAGLRRLYAATLVSVRAHDNGGLPQGP